MATPPNPFLLAADLLDPPAPSGDAQLAVDCAAKLSTFVRAAWPIVEPATPFVSGWHIDVVCEHLEAVTAGELPRLIINVPPRTMKSLTVSVFWPAWEWLTSPHIRWLYASYAEDLSQRDSLKCRRLIRAEGGRQDGTLFERIGYQGVLRLLGQSWSLMKDQDAKRKYETTATGMRLATSVGGLATGEGGDRIVVDDPLNAKQARSETERQAANVWWDETMTTRFNSASGVAVIVMQRLHEDDLTGHLLEQGGWHHLCLPGEYEPRHKHTYPPKVKLPSGREISGDPRTTEGELLEPVRLSGDRLAELRRSLGSYGFAGQIQQRPSPQEGGMFKRGWWRYWTARDVPSADEWDRLIQSWDLTFKDTKSASGSYVVGQVWAARAADRYLLAQVRGRMDFTGTVKAIEAVSREWPTSAKLVEEKANGAAVISTLKGKIGGLVPVEPEGGKEARAAAVEPFVEAGNVYLPAGEHIPTVRGYPATSVADFIEEHAMFPNGRHDDQVDAHSQALTYLARRRKRWGPA